MPANHTITAPPDLQPGVGPDCLACLHEMDMVAVGADTAAVAWGFPPIVGDTSARPCVSSSMRPGAPVAVAAVTVRSASVMAARRSLRRCRLAMCKPRPFILIQHHRRSCLRRR